MKKYKSCSTIALNVILPKSGKSRHIAFDTNYGLGSCLYVENKEIQDALENHPLFNKTFFLEEDLNEEEQKQEEKQEEKQEARVFKVFSINEAKDILAREEGVLRSNIKTKQQVLEVAKEKNIVFEGL